MTRSEVQEAFATLYLRLNGYFTSGFIVHSDRLGANRTELDVLAVRLPHNAEPVREIDPAPELETWSGGIDFIIGEVKSRGQRLQFNGALRNSRESIATVLQWWGHLTADEVHDFTDPLKKILAPAPGATSVPTLSCPRNARVRALLFSPERKVRRQNQSWFIPGPPMFEHVWRCLRPVPPREASATIYDFGRWGYHLEPIVSYFKDTTRREPGNFQQLVDYLGVSAR